MTMLTLALCVVKLFTSHLFTVFSFVQKCFAKGYWTSSMCFLPIGNHVRLTCLWTFWLRKHIELIMHWAKERCFADCCMHILHTLMDPTLACYIDFEQASVRKPCKNYPGANETMHLQCRLYFSETCKRVGIQISSQRCRDQWIETETSEKWLHPNTRLQWLVSPPYYISRPQLTLDYLAYTFVRYFLYIFSFLILWHVHIYIRYNIYIYR